MKINIVELKKWCDIKVSFLNILNNLLFNWYDLDFKKSIEYNTFFEYNFIKNDVIDLKSIVIFDEYLFEICVLDFFEKLNIKYSDESNMKIDFNKIMTASEEDLMIQNDVIDYKKSVYYKSLKNFGFINNRNEIEIDVLNKFPNIKKEYIKISLNNIMVNGYDYNEIITKSLIKLNIIGE